MAKVGNGQVVHRTLVAAATGSMRHENRLQLTRGRLEAGNKAILPMALRALIQFHWLNSTGQAAG